MSVPLHSAVIVDLYPRAAVFSLGPMHDDPTLANVTMPDFGLQLILDGLGEHRLFPVSGPGAAELADMDRLRRALDFKAFCATARHHIYDVTSVISRDEEWGNHVRLTVLGRFPWLFSSLREGLSWESFAFCFAD